METSSQCPMSYYAFVYYMDRIAEQVELHGLESQKQAIKNLQTDFHDDAEVIMLYCDKLGWGKYSDDYEIYDENDKPIILETYFELYNLLAENLYRHRSCRLAANRR